MQNNFKLQVTKAVSQRVNVKNAFLEILQDSQENTWARVYCLMKLQACGNINVKIYVYRVFYFKLFQLV